MSDLGISFIEDLSQIILLVMHLVKELSKFSDFSTDIFKFGNSVMEMLVLFLLVTQLVSQMLNFVSEENSLLSSVIELRSKVVHIVLQLVEIFIHLSYLIISLVEDLDKVVSLRNQLVQVSLQIVNDGSQLFLFFVKVLVVVVKLVFLSTVMMMEIIDFLCFVSDFSVSLTENTNEVVSFSLKFFELSNEVFNLTIFLSKEVIKLGKVISHSSNLAVSFTKNVN
mmetsp:Transcript_57384/g.65763  ORF Transcript_57384/g.65763 Transcript_57384/m.65763 type:complete len:224 (+) Transcript_57384:69-740(+)